jgi:hypothetical protein
VHSRHRISRRPRSAAVRGLITIAEFIASILVGRTLGSAPASRLMV